MSASEILKGVGAGSFVMPGTAPQRAFMCARCRSYNVHLLLHTPEAEFELSVRLVCGSCDNYLEAGLVPTSEDSDDNT